MPKRLIPLSVAMQSLQGVSHLAAQAWRNVLAADTPEQEASELEWLWQMQDSQEDLIDAHAELADQIDAEFVAIEARLKYTTQVHQKELERLQRWRTKLDAIILQLNQEGILGTEAAGNTRRIHIKLNPPSCEVIDLTQVPEQYVNVKVVEERKVDKAAVKAAWSQGSPVPGTEVTRRQKVVYELAPTSLQRMKATASDYSHSGGSFTTNSISALFLGVRIRDVRTSPTIWLISQELLPLLRGQIARQTVTSLTD